MPETTGLGEATEGQLQSCRKGKCVQGASQAQITAMPGALEARDGSSHFSPDWSNTYSRKSDFKWGQGRKAGSDSLWGRKEMKTLKTEPKLATPKWQWPRVTGSRGCQLENKDRPDTAGHTAVSPGPVSGDYSQCPLHLRELLQLPEQSDNREDGRAVTSGRDWVHARARASLPALGAELSSSGALPPPLH